VFVRVCLCCEFVFGKLQSAVTVGFVPIEECLDFSLAEYRCACSALAACRSGCTVEIASIFSLSLIIVRIQHRNGSTFCLLSMCVFSVEVVSTLCSLADVCIQHCRLCALLVLCVFSIEMVSTVGSLIDLRIQQGVGSVLF
jgi:hypothetical protein